MKPNTAPGPRTSEPIMYPILLPLLVRVVDAGILLGHADQSTDNENVDSGDDDEDVAYFGTHFVSLQ